MAPYGPRELAESFRIVRKNTIQVAHDIPEEKYGFRAAEGVQSVGEMLAHVALGKRNSQIAAQLTLTEATVKSYLSAAMRKLNASTRYEAVIAARRAGLIP